jgi:hypothetical protein
MHRHWIDSPLRALRTAFAAIVLAVLAACAATPGPSAVELLRARIAAGDLAGADALIAARPEGIDARRALDLALRGGHVEATRHYVARVGPDVELDPDATTPLIRAVVDAPSAQRPALVAALREAGADPTRRDRYGRDARAYAAARGASDLLALLADTPAVVAGPAAPPAFAAWLGATGTTTLIMGEAGASGSSGAQPAAVTPAAPAAAPARSSGRASQTARPATSTKRPKASQAGASTLPASAHPARASTAAASGATLAPGPITPGTLLRRSPWRPAASAATPTEPQAALRFHADGTADVLQLLPGMPRADPLPGTYAAWRIDAGRLRLAMVGDAFAAGCIGGAQAGSGEEPDRLSLSCEPLPPPAPVAGAGWSQDLARAMLDEIDVPRGPSIVAVATGRTALEDVEHGGHRVLPVSLQGGVPGATCRPARARPRAAVASPRVIGDWIAMDVRRFDAVAPLSGSLCPQTQARDAAMKACRQGAGRDAAAACRSVGGCPVGQASALAGLPGVEAGWVACDPDPGAARRKALDACRADLGCDCQLAALSGRNLVVGAGGAQCRAPSR